jgi:hypothetical protein
MEVIRATRQADRPALAAASANHGRRKAARRRAGGHHGARTSRTRHAHGTRHETVIVQIGDAARSDDVKAAMSLQART